MTKFFQACGRLARREDGVSALEYSLMAALIALTIAGTAATFGGDMKTLFGKFSTCVKTPASCTL